MCYIPDDILVQIFSRVGLSGFRHLGPLITATRRTKNAVFSPDVLKLVDVSDFMLDSSMANIDSIYRSFFSACVNHGNVEASQLEALRLLCQEGPAATTFQMLRVSHSDTIYWNFILGIFLICSGDFTAGMEAVSNIWDMVETVDEAVAVADMVVAQIVNMGTRRAGIYFTTFTYPRDEVPHCTGSACSLDDVCAECFAFWYSHIIRAMC